MVSLQCVALMFFLIATCDSADYRIESQTAWTNIILIFYQILCINDLFILQKLFNKFYN